MQENKFIMPPMANKFILRSTGEEVEVIDSEIKIRGDRTDEDWVTYIDAQGKEHIKEKLNIQLDFKPQANSVFEKMLEMPSFQKIPSMKNQRVFEVAKELVKNGSHVSSAVSIARQLIEEIGEE